MRCIICKVDKSNEEFNKEHIFPESIGGNITLNCVCIVCNSTLGHKVDSYLVNHKFIQCERLLLGISGKSGKIPNPLEEGYINSSNKKIKYIFDAGKPKELCTFPDIKINCIGNEEIEIRVEADKKERDKLPLLINKKLKRLGLPELSKKEIDKIQNTQALPGYRPWIHYPWEIDIFRYQRAILKIAYELAYYWLGESYLDDKVGELLRLCISDPALEGNWIRKYPLAARIEFIGERKNLWFPWKDDNDHHIALIDKVNRRIVCYIKIFNVFQGLITISISPTLYPKFSNKFIAINAQTKEMRESDLDIELLNLYMSWQHN